MTTAVPALDLLSTMLDSALTPPLHPSTHGRAPLNLSSATGSQMGMGMSMSMRSPGQAWGSVFVSAFGDIQGLSYTPRLHHQSTAL